MSPKKKQRSRRRDRARKRAFAQSIPSGDKRSRREEQNVLQQTPVWSFEVLDIKGQWGWDNDEVKSLLWTEIVPKLQNFETMTWAEISQVAGGRTRGNNHHHVGVGDLTREAQKRLSEINQDDVDEIFSFRLAGKKRIYGIREGRVLKLLWYDPFHGNNKKAVVPVST